MTLERGPTRAFGPASDRPGFELIHLVRARWHMGPAVSDVALCGLRGATRSPSVAEREPGRYCVVCLDLAGPEFRRRIEL